MGKVEWRGFHNSGGVLPETLGSQLLLIYQVSTRASILGKQNSSWTNWHITECPHGWCWGLGFKGQLRNIFVVESFDDSSYVWWNMPSSHPSALTTEGTTESSTPVRYLSLALHRSGCRQQAQWKSNRELWEKTLAAQAVRPAREKKMKTDHLVEC